MGQEFFQRMYSVPELYTTLYRGLRTMKYLSKTKKNRELSMGFIERIMLAVTEVNGCEVCSYGHTKIALEHGMSYEEIQLLLSGSNERIPEEEVTAVLFAQHYADTRGNPSSEAWQRVVTDYGTAKALGILGATRAIMIGNVAGIAFSAFLRRLKGSPVKQSSLFYETGMLLCSGIFVPVALLHSLISNLLNKPVISFPDRKC